MVKRVVERKEYVSVINILHKCLRGDWIKILKAMKQI